MKLVNWFLNIILHKKLFYTSDIAEAGQDYSVYCLWEIDKDGIVKLKKINHSSK